MLVICCGMPRSASTLQYQMASELVEALGVGRRAGWDWPAVEPSMAEAARPIRVVKVHDPNPELERKFVATATRYIYSRRDVRDAIASYTQKEGQRSPEQIAALARRWLSAGAWFTSRPNCLIAEYESLRDDPIGELRRIEAHLEASLEPRLRRRIVQRLSIEAQRRRLDAGRWRNREPWDDWTLLHPNHIGDAETGKWRALLTDEQIDAIDQVKDAIKHCGVDNREPERGVIPRTTE